MNIRLSVFTVFWLLQPISIGFANANGIGESVSWQFDTTSDRANKGFLAEAIERKRADTYRTTYDIDYNIARDYVNCTVSATTAGNQESIMQDAPLGSPDITISGEVASETTGNRSDAQLDTSVRAVHGDTRVKNSSDVPGGRDSTKISDLSTWSGTQSNANSALNSEVSGSAVSTTLGETRGDAASGQVALNSHQSNDYATLTSEVNSSNACAFDRNTGRGE